MHSELVFNLTLFVFAYGLLSVTLCTLQVAFGHLLSAYVCWL